jgi:hypothetical protein
MTDDYGALMGRSLLWNFDSYKIMDRIYTTCDEDLLFYFKQWATENGYLYKSEQNWYNTLQFEQVGQKKQELKLEISIDADCRYFPYMDTFKFLDTKTGKLYNYQFDSKYLRTLCSSEGTTYEKDYLRFDGIDRVLRYQGDSAWVEYLSIYTHYNNITWSEVNGQYILNEHVYYHEGLNEPIFNKEYDHLNNYDLIDSRLNEIKAWEERRKNKKSLSDLSTEDLMNTINSNGWEVSEEDIQSVLDLIGRRRQNV